MGGTTASIVGAGTQGFANGAMSRLCNYKPHNAIISEKVGGYTRCSFKGDDTAEVIISNDKALVITDDHNLLVDLLKVSDERGMTVQVFSGYRGGPDDSTTSAHYRQAADLYVEDYSSNTPWLRDIASSMGLFN